MRLLPLGRLLGWQQSGKRRRSAHLQYCPAVYELTEAPPVAQCRTGKRRRHPKQLSPSPGRVADVLRARLLEFRLVCRQAGEDSSRLISVFPATFAVRVSATVILQFTLDAILASEHQPHNVALPANPGFNVKLLCSESIFHVVLTRWPEYSIQPHQRSPSSRCLQTVTS